MSSESAPDFAAESHQRHQQHWRRLLTEEWAESAAKMLRENTVNGWRRNRFFETLPPLLKHWPGSSWLTIGDGRFGTDACYLLSQGVEAHATDITDEVLREAAARGFIRSYSAENAEKLSFADLSFDWVLCKESLHHFPRPMLGFYEMLRVARHGLVLMEPNDLPAMPSPFGIFWRFVKQALSCAPGGCLDWLAAALPRPAAWRWHDEWEEINYVYGLSQHDIEKASLALHLGAVAIYGVNDHHQDGVGREPAVPGNAVFENARREIRRRDRLCRLGVRKYDSLVAIVFRNVPSDAVVQSLRDAGFSVRILPRGPEKPGAAA